MAGSQQGWRSGVSGGSTSGVQSVTGLNTDNTDPLNPIINISVDGVTITGDGTPLNPLVSVADGVQSVTGLDTDNTDPANPIVNISVDGVTITGDGTPLNPLVSVADGVQSVTGLDTDNTDPLNPIVNISVDGVTITGDGTPLNPLVSVTNIPQSNIIYIDSNPLIGINSTGRGNINNPYLTPEYALVDITNTGTVTGTTTNGSATLTAVSSTASIVVGQVISGAGISWGSVVQSKTVNTIVLSQLCTANATITVKWLTIYELNLSGNFIATSNWFKEGFYFARNESVSVSWGAFSLYEITTLQTFDYFNNSGFNYNGLTSTSDIFKNLAVQQDVLFNCVINGSECTSMTTGILFFSGGGVYQQRGNYTFNFQKAIAKFGYVMVTPYYFAYATLTVNIPYSYGLLGGVNGKNGSVFSGNWNGTIETPASVYAFEGTYINHTGGEIRGSFNMQGIRQISSRIDGTTCILNGITCFSYVVQTISCVANVNFYGSTNNSFNITGLNNKFFGSSNFGINLSGTSSVDIYTEVSNLYQLTLTGTSTVNIQSKLGVANTFTVGGGCVVNVNNKLTLSNGATITGTLNQNDDITLYGTIDMIAGCVYNLYKSLIGTTAVTTTPLISKVGGTLNLYPSSKLKVANSKPPIKCTLNTADSKDIFMFGCISNGNSSTYGLFFAFDGGSYVPNDLVGGVLYENTIY